jgi:hypothetical protein
MVSTVIDLTPAELAASSIGGIELLQATDIVATSNANDLASLTGSQPSLFTDAPISGMSATHAVASAAVNPILQDVQRLEVGAALSYGAMLTVLEDADSSGMTAGKMQGLQALLGELNTGGGIQVSSYVQQIAYDVIAGNSANVAWNGGNSTAVALGNLSATSTQTQLGELIGKWFLGTDLPSMNLAGVGGNGGIPVAYQATNLPLFGPKGPSNLDINQGDVGDCYFLSSLGEVAMQDPSLIKSMIQSDGNGDYAVRFDINGRADYVTVDDYLPTMQGGYRYSNGDTLLFANSGSSLWVALVEKAYTQLMEQTSVIAGASLGQHGDAYEDISGGSGQCLTELTGESYTTYWNLGSDSIKALGSMLTTLQGDLSSGEAVILGTSGNGVTDNLVAGHMFMVTGVNAAADTMTLQNPWGTANCASSGKAFSFTESIAAIGADNATIYATLGKASNF